MLYTFKQKSGATGVVAWGKINTDPKSGTSKNGKRYCNFYLKYDFEPKKSPNDKASGKTIQISTWEGTADFASHCEKGDSVIVFGQLRKNEYKGEESYQVAAEIVLSPSAQQIALNSAMAIDSMKGKQEHSAQSPAANEADDVFSDIDDDDINSIFPSL